MKTAAALDARSLTVFCDFDGPLVDVSERYYSTYKLALTQTCDHYRFEGETLFPQLLSKQQFWKMKQERVCDLEIALRSGLREQHFPFFLQQVHQLVNQPVLAQKDRLHYGVNWALALLHSQGLRLVLVTLRCHAQVTQILQNYGLKRLFQAIYTTSDYQAAYPNNTERKTQLLQQALASQTHSCAYMIGDTEADILAAKAFGIPAIALTCGIRSPSYLQQYQPQYICSDLLCAAHHLLGISQAFPPTVSNCESQS